MADQTPYQAILGPVASIAADASVARQTANAKAYQAVAQAAALGVQSAASYAMNIATVSEATTSVATVKVVESVASGQVKKAVEWALVALYAQLVMATGPLFMMEVGAAAKKVLEDFPST